MAEGGYRSPVVQPPTCAQIQEIAAKLGLGKIDHQDLQDYHRHLCRMAADYNTLYKYPEPTLPVKYPRTPGYRPAPQDNKHNAWYYKTEIQGAGEGLLVGKKVAIKDNIPVSGVPMMNGSTVMEGYTPDYDATVVTRILDNGGCIVGKTVCEPLCFSAAGFLPSTGPVTNPYDETHVSGGSSSGSAVLVALGEVDMALGCDQGGSIRIPASCCGVVGLKATIGLVPYTGIPGLSPHIDHVGPITRTVADCALLLQAIAGYDDGLDFRQHRDLKIPNYSKCLTEDLSGVRVALLTEGFQHCKDTVSAIVRDAAFSLTQAGASVEETSIPMFTDRKELFLPLNTTAINVNFIHGAGFGVGMKGYYPTSLITNIFRSFRAESSSLPPTLKLNAIMGEYVKEHYGTRHYARAQNLSECMTAAINQALDTHHVLVLPTLNKEPAKLPQPNSSIYDLITEAECNLANTSIFNVTGHPVISINAGFSQGLPVGMSIVGKHLDECTVLKVAYALEKLQQSDSK